MLLSFHSMPRTPKPRYDGELMVSDAGKLGWNIPALARAAGLSYKTTARFVSGQVQTAPVAAKLATALGKTLRRYFSHVEAA